MRLQQKPWLVIVALATGGFAIGTTEFSTMGLLPLIEHSLHITAPTAGHLISAYALGVVVGAPAIMVAAARLARKPLLGLLMSAFALGNALSALAPGYGWLMGFRFLSGLPHGAYFGLTALVAASVVAPERRAQAVGWVMLGLTVATIAGVPLATWLGAAAGWRAGYWAVTALALITLALLTLFAPLDKAASDAGPLAELNVLRRAQVWVTLAIGAIGFGGLFAIYTYLTETFLTETLHQLTHMPLAWLPVVLGVFGLGMTAGNLVVPRFADRALMPTVGATLVWSAVSLALFTVAAGSAGWVMLDVFCIGIGGSLAALLQTRLMDVAGESQNLAAALNHVAFNAANALGPFLAGLALANGYGLRATGAVGCALAIAGFLVWLIACRLDRFTTMGTRQTG